MQVTRARPSGATRSYERCATSDVGKAMVVTSVRRPHPAGRHRRSPAAEVVLGAPALVLDVSTIASTGGHIDAGDLPGRAAKGSAGRPPPVEPLDLS